MSTTTLQCEPNLNCSQFAGHLYAGRIKLNTWKLFIGIESFGSKRIRIGCLVLLVCCWTVVSSTMLCRQARCQQVDEDAGGFTGTHDIMGKISGTVFEAGPKTPLVEAGVEAIPANTREGVPGKFALTNKEGFFIIEVPAGTYTLKITYPNYEKKIVKGIVVNPGAHIKQTLALSPSLVKIDEMRVVAKPKGDVELVQLMKRRVASNILDNISAESISKIPESDVAGILTRMPGVTINDGQFMQARGMPKRYNRSTFNGASLPTTKPNEKLVPLNLFPAGVVESLNVAKSYSPDLPANFSGGLCQIQTKSIPDDFLLKLSGTMEYNTSTTNKDYLTNRGGDKDWLGYDDGTRDKPDIVPDAKVVRQGRFTSGGQDPYTLETISESFNDDWDAFTKTAPWNHDFTILTGNRFNKFGFMFTASYKNEYQNRENEKNNIYSSQGGGELKRDNYYTFERSKRKVRVSGIANCGLELTPDHKIYFNNFYVHTGENEVTYYEGFNSDIGDSINDTRLRWVEEEIYSGQIVGDHMFYALFDHEIDWRYTYSFATMWEPDLREYEYEYNAPSDSFNFADESMSGFHMWTRQEEDIHDFAFNWAVKFEQWSGLTTTFKFGIAYLERDREFWSRRFRFMPYDTSRIDMSASVENILSRENINRYEFEIQETTRTTDTYDADQRIKAGYFMLDLPLTEKLRLAGGYRYEDNEINMVSFDLFDPNNVITTAIESDDWFPSLNLTYSILDGMNVRLGYSETVSRPEFHELAPFEFTDVRGGRAIKGNPDLRVAEIENYDFRWEWFINDTDLIAVSVFYKDFADAIEKTIQPTIELRTSFVNADSAELFGVELELRKNLEFISPYLRHYNIIGNYIYSDSEAEITPRPGFVPTNTKRKMVGQADHTYNLTFEYDNPDWGFTGRILFQYISDRINEVGGLGLPDILLEDSVRWDIVFIKKLYDRFELKLIGENITNEGVTYTQGGLVFHRWREGVSWKVKLSYKW